MTNIKNVNEYCVSGVFSVNTSIKAFKDSNDSKQLTLRVHMNSVPLRDLITKSLRSVTIAWQNSSGRSRFEKWTNHSTVDIEFNSPNKKVKSNEEKINELFVGFCAAGVEKDQALELATKAVNNPVILSESNEGEV